MQKCLVANSGRQDQNVNYGCVWFQWKGEERRFWWANSKQNSRNEGHSSELINGGLERRVQSIYGGESSGDRVLFDSREMRAQLAPHDKYGPICYWRKQCRQVVAARWPTLRGLAMQPTACLQRTKRWKWGELFVWAVATLTSRVSNTKRHSSGRHGAPNTSHTQQ